MKKLSLILILVFAAFSFLKAQQTFLYAEKNGQKLYLDVYKSQNTDIKKPLLIYVFGGGFIMGERYDKAFLPFIKGFNDQGFDLVCIDYRLGLKNQSCKPGIFSFSPLLKAISMAVEDLLSATDFLLKNPKLTGVNAENTVIMGSSAGAITVLQADYSICNGLVEKGLIRDDFRYKGVVAFAGAIFSSKGRIRYRNAAPAPTMMFHGTSDKVVTYKQINLLKWHFTGTKKLTKKFEKHNYPYFTYRYEGLGHEVNFFVERNLDDVSKFIDEYVIQGKKIKKDMTVKDPSIKVKSVSSTKELYKNN